MSAPRDERTLGKASDLTKFHIHVEQHMAKKQLIEYFKQFGTAVDFSFTNSTGKHPFTFGFVVYKGDHFCIPSKEDHEIDGIKISVKKDGVGTQFRVSGFPIDTQKSELDAYFAQFGTIKHTFIDSTKCYGFVTFEGDNSCVPSLDTHKIRGSVVSVSIRNYKNQDVPADCTKFKLSFANGETVTKEQLDNHFRTFGELIDSDIINGTQGNYAFVMFKGKHSFCANGSHVIEGKTVSVCQIGKTKNAVVDENKVEETQKGYDWSTWQDFYVIGFPVGTMKSEFDAYFAQFGALKHTFVDSTNCYGWVHFEGKHSCVPSSDTHKIRGSLVTVTVLGKARNHELPAGCTRFKLIFVNGETVTKEELHNYLRNFGEIIDSIIIAGKYGNHAFVLFKGKHSFAHGTHVIEGKIAKAKGFDSVEIKASNVKYVEDDYQKVHDAPDGQKFHVSGLPIGTQKSDLKAFFEQFGTVQLVIVNSKRCFGYVVFEGEHSCVPSLDTHKIRGSVVSVSVPRNHTLPADCTKFKLSFADGQIVTKEQLDNYLRNFGEIIDSFVFVGKQGNHAFVTFKGKHSFCANGTHVIEGKIVSVSQDNPRKQKVSQVEKTKETKVEPALNVSLKRKAVEPEVVEESLNSNVVAVVDESLKSKDAVVNESLKSKDSVKEATVGETKQRRKKQKKEKK